MGNQMVNQKKEKLYILANRMKWERGLNNQEIHLDDLNNKKEN